ncbi:virginiamycin B lyase family protein [Pedosphaera parvula]|uniref:Immunoglobulin I-set domain protein n=1 Tax=Pedosphaera parvula (strain Ellin514) TaxID=320771 RepID=B9XIE8_PEDPL|nr:immunoglobulin domain-containing protein [Pedosphaera parvula]EEF60409.1 Immunoglobulin I-set domain protein [Pedosphaera parvula Ellin514]
MNNQKTSISFKTCPAAIRCRGLGLAFLATLLVFTSLMRAGAAPEVNIFPFPVIASLPQSITLGPDGNLWLTQFSGNRIARIQANASSVQGPGFITEFVIPTADTRPYGITTGPDGNLWFTEAHANRIGRITTNGVFLPEFLIPTATNSNPAGITKGSDGRVWFTQLTYNALGAVTASGVFSQYRGITGNGNVIATNSLLYNITPGPDGNLWFVEGAKAKIGSINPTNHVVHEYTLPTAGSVPFDIVSDSKNSLWFTEYAGQRIGSITTNGVISEFKLPSATSVLSTNGPYGITIDTNNGVIWFSEYNSNSVGSVDISTHLVTEYHLPATNYFPTLSYLVLNPKDSHVWITEPTGNTYYHFFVQQKPAITKQPQGKTVNPGTNVTFTVTATGPAPLHYQWLLNGTNIGSATQSSFVITNVQTTNGGNYSVKVSNNFGSVTSSSASLTVNSLVPVLLSEPLSQTVDLGTNVSFSATAAGAAPLTYQWLFNGTNIGGATQSSFVITNVQTNNAGNYSIVVTNAFGSITSSNALLNVIIPPIAVPVLFSKIQRLPGGDTGLTLSGQAGDKYEVDGSTNLANWLLITNFTISTTPYQVIIKGSSNSPSLFYRARLLP